MSSSRRRGRSSGSPATSQPAPAADTAPETDAAEANERSQDTGSVEAAEGVIEAESAAAGTATETAAIPEIPAETSPETVQAAVAESVSDTAGQAADTVGTLQDDVAETAAETTEAVTERTADAVEPVARMVQAAATESVSEAAEQADEVTESVTEAVTERTADAVEPVVETVEAAQAHAAEQAAGTIEQVGEAAMALAAAPLAAAQAASPQRGGTTSFAATASTRFTPFPTFEPLNEINATLLAFARGEGEAAVAHFQALTKVKSPAEAIRLQVSEFQRAADASLTCFSHILRSANRLGGPAHRN